MGGTTDIKVRIKKCTNLEGNSMLPGWSSDPYVIVKLCEKKEELEKFQTKTVSNCANPEFDESHKFKKLKHPSKLKLKFEVWDSDVRKAASPRHRRGWRTLIARPRRSAATTRSATVTSCSETSRRRLRSRISRWWSMAATSRTPNYVRAESEHLRAP